MDRNDNKFANNMNLKSNNDNTSLNRRNQKEDEKMNINELYSFNNNTSNNEITTNAYHRRD